jgi:uncharacterized membrane protein
MGGLLIVSILVALFAGSHVWLASAGLRPWLVERLGERGFFIVYSLVAAILWTLLIGQFAVHRLSGPAGLALGSTPHFRWPLMTLATAGLTLAGAGIVVYPRLPSALFDQPIRMPYGIERISRHPFFAGFAVFALAHVLLVTHLVSTVFFAGLALLAVIGAHLQDRKLAQRRGVAYTTYLARTSFWPFAAQLRGEPLVARELPWYALGGSLLVALWFRQVHASLFAYGGAWVILALIGGAAVASFNAWRRARRHRARTASAALAPAPSVRLE